MKKNVQQSVCIPIMKAGIAKTVGSNRTNYQRHQVTSGMQTSPCAPLRGVDVSRQHHSSSCSRFPILLPW